jgi:tetratricopeptide (TPR) repeat protein
MDGTSNPKWCPEKVVPKMEDNPQDPDSLAHHQAAAHMPKILPTALIKEALQQQTAANMLGIDARSASLDIEAYKNRLNKIWRYNHASTAQGLVISMVTDIATISATLDQANGEDQRAARDILCRYLQTYGHIMRDQGQYAEAIVALEEAVKIAEYINNNQLLAVSLLRLGNVYHDRGDSALAQAKIATASDDSTAANAQRASADADLQSAVEQFARVRSRRKISPEIHIALLMGEGNAQARMAHGKRDAILASLTLLNQAEKILANHSTQAWQGDEYSLFASSSNVAKRQLQISKASALLAANWPREALQELTDMLNLPPQGNMIRMNAYTNFLWAQGYADTAKIDGAALLAQDTLTVMKQISSEVNIARIDRLYRQLISTDNRQIEVIRLGVMLTR